MPTRRSHVPDSPTALSGADALSHPLVLRGAWLRVDEWYRGGNLAPEPELCCWRLHPEQELRRLGAELGGGQWQPSPWRQLPYPKKNARLRHYVLPTVRDQVAFMAHMVLLGPLLDNQTKNFAFGNRWYRTLAWDRRQESPRWVSRAYPLLTTKSYLPYARSHGLFRRVTHWTVARMTGARVDGEDYGGRVQQPDDYLAESLPPWIREDWWSSDASVDRRAYWATIDVELAYPSVRLDRLRECLVEMLADVGQLEELLRGYPASILKVLAQRNERQQVGTRLVDALEQVRVETSGIPPDAWRPFHAAPQLPPDNTGLPTGLAISGALLNVALHSTDSKVSTYLDLQKGNRRGAIVRFADDMFVLSRSMRGLLELIDEVWRALADDTGARLSVRVSQSNLYLNLTKIQPQAVKNVVEEYLRSEGWNECEDGNDCTQLVPPHEPREETTLGDRWARGTIKKIKSLRDALERSSVGPKEVGPFVTSLVARMSEIGTDTLNERFGEGARERLVRLHELARFDINDEQVRAETRRTFAANRLIRAWLPMERSEARNALMDIRDSVAYVLNATPWKFALWSAVVRAAARRPNREIDGGDDTACDDCDARDWLSSQLQGIAHAADADGPPSWMHTWPEECADGEHERDPRWRALYLSFHRTAFWHAYGEVLRELWRHHDRTTHPQAGDSGPPPRWWTVRAVPQDLHEHVAKFLGALDQWVDVLYPRSNSEPDLAALPWELDQLVAAVLASGPRFDLAEAWRRSERPGDVLMIPETPFLPHAARTTGILKRLGRVQPSRRRARFLNSSALAHVRLGGPDRRLGELLFPADRSPRIIGGNQDPMHVVSVGASLGCSESIGRDLVSQLVSQPHVVVRRLQKDPLTLLEYSRARRILLGHK